MSGRTGSRLASVPAAAAARRIVAAALFITLLGGCGSAATSPVPSGPVTLPPGTVVAEIPEAGIALPVPAGWRQLRADDLADPAIRAEIASTLPGSDALVSAVEAANSRADLVFIALDPSTVAGDGTPANVAVLVSQPSVSGPLLDFVAGFIDSGFRDTLELGESERSSARTPLGDAVRLAYRSRPAKPVTVAWVVGAPRGTLLISTMGLARAGDGLEPDAIIAAVAAIP